MSVILKKDFDEDDDYELASQNQPLNSKNIELHQQTLTQMSVNLNSNMSVANSTILTTSPSSTTSNWRTRTLKRNWLRLPRSLKIYLLVGVIFALTILAFSTTRMLPVLATTRVTQPQQQPQQQQHVPPQFITQQSLLVTTSMFTATPASPPAPIVISPLFQQSQQQNIQPQELLPTHLSLPIPLNTSSGLDLITLKRRQHIKEMMQHAWDNYERYAWGYNELRPISKQPHFGSVFHNEKMGATIVDAIDTLFIMGMNDEYRRARDWIEQNLDFNNFNNELSVFETNIRFVGGLLSIYALTGDRMFLQKATQCAQKLLPAFDTPSGIPRSFVNLRTGESRNADWTLGGAILSEFGSIHLEFYYLSYATGDPIYREKIEQIRHVIRTATPRDDRLYNNYIDVRTGQWLTNKVHVSMGGLGDSFYEYLLKAYVQSGGRDHEALTLYNDAIAALERKLIFTSNPSRLVYFAEYLDGTVMHKMGTLACFSGGMLAMGGQYQPTRQQHEHYVRLGAEIARTCHESCVRANASIGPEVFVFTRAVEARAFRMDDKSYLLRPEILETYFYMWRYTHNPIYRQWAWDFVEALDKHCRVDGGYSGLRNVYDPHYLNLDDVQQSFFLAEVLKYLYLIFSDDQLMSLNDWVFNTEAHPLPILKKAALVSPKPLH